MLEQCVNA